jgi:ATP-dependent helicase/nuclease subunit A
VQLLTVHGAKGLEAHTVLMLDANAQAEKARSMDVLIDWPAEQTAPTTFAFLASESAPPACVQSALAHEQAARAREETNALYVAMTRAQHTLALSAHEVRTIDPTSPWQRFATLDAAVVQDVPTIAVEGASPAAQATEQAFYIKKMPLAQWNIARAAIKDVAVDKPTVVEDTTASRIGQAMHRLLELYTPGYDLTHAARSVGAQFQLDTAQSAQALALAQRITQGEAAWVWDAAVIDWQANEVELVHGGELLRLDRVVRHQASQTWWVLDYKSASAPQLQADLRAQLARYAQAVLESTHLAPGQAATPASVRAAFITGEGKVVAL